MNERVSDLQTETTWSELDIAERMRLVREQVLNRSKNKDDPPPLPVAQKLLIDLIVEKVQTIRPLSQVKEKPFSSDIPLVGPLIVSLRYGWNWMATKWWVRPLLRQQNEFNEEIVKLCEELAILAGALGRQRQKIEEQEQALEEQLQAAMEMQQSLQMHLKGLEQKVIK